MMNKASAYSLFAASLFLSACNAPPPEAYYSRGAPESLLDVSSEVVSVSLSEGGSMEELTNWVNQEQPSRAELACEGGEEKCDRARDVLEQFGVPYEKGDVTADSVKLYYERVQARDCENRFIDNSSNPYNLNHPTFGCSLAANMVQQVTDKRQFVNPNLLDFSDAEKAAQVYGNYRKERPNTGDSTGSQLSTSGITP